MELIVQSSSWVYRRAAYQHTLQAVARSDIREVS